MNIKKIFLLLVLLIILNLIFINSFDKNYNYYDGQKIPKFSFEDSYVPIIESLLIDKNEFNTNDLNVFRTPFLASYIPVIIKDITSLDIYTSLLLFLFLFYNISILIIFVFLDKLFNSIIASVSTLIFLSNPYVILIASEPIRMFINIILLIFSLYLIIKARSIDNYDGDKYIILSSFFLGFSFMVHYTGFLFFLIIFLYILFFYKIKKLIFFILPFFTLAASWFIFKNRFQVNNEFIKQIPYLTQYKNALIETLNNQFNNSFGPSFIKIIIKNLGLYGNVMFFFSLLGALLILYEIIKNKNDPLSKQRLLIILWTVFLTLFFIIAYPSSSHYSRYPIFIFLPIYILAIVGFYNPINLKGKFNEKILVLTIIIIIALSSLSLKIPTYNNQYSTRLDSGEAIGKLLSDPYNNCTIAIEGWPSMVFSYRYLYPDLTTNKNNKVFNLGFDLSRNNTITINKEVIENNNICYFFYEKVTCFNELCPNNKYMEDILVSGFLLEEKEKFIDPINNDRFIILYKINKNETKL